MFPETKDIISEIKHSFKEVVDNVRIVILGIFVLILVTTVLRRQVAAEKVKNRLKGKR